MPPIDTTPPEIDYLARDFASFRRLMLDHLSQLVPDWKDQNPADLGYALVEALAYAADHLSYYQDAVATEAYLSTARLRRSVRRHVRLLEYYLQEGCNARAWVQVQVGNHLFLPARTRLLPRLPDFDGPVIHEQDMAYARAVQDGVPVFETMHPVYLSPALNELPLLPESAQETVLKQGATRAALYCAKLSADAHDYPQEGAVLVLAQRPGGKTGSNRPEHCHAVRLTHVTLPKGDDRIATVEWAGADALPEDLCVGPFDPSDPDSSPAVALGNIVLADHGRTVYSEELPAVEPQQRYRPRLRLPDLTFAAPFYWRTARKQPAIQCMTFKPYEAYACLHLQEFAAFSAARVKNSREPMLLEDLPGEDWQPLAPKGEYKRAAMQYAWTLRRDLLNSGPFDRDFQVEMEGDRQASLRFGFGGAGKLPDPGERFVATYRVGNGSKGNVGAGTIAHLVDSVHLHPAKARDAHKERHKDRSAERAPQAEVEELQGTKDLVLSVSNLLPARGGADPEDIETARLHAPYAYRDQKACVTPQDYALRACQHPAVVHAAAHMHWNGSRRTVVVFVQRSGGKRVDEAFQQELLEFIEPFRLMGHEVLVENPSYVPVRVALDISLQPRVAVPAVRAALERAFARQPLPDGTTGFFYTDRFDFGQSLHQSPVIARAMAVPGVRDVQVREFRRVPDGQNGLEIPVEPGEIIALEEIEFCVEGSL
jgi:hypothetical protein